MPLLTLWPSLLLWLLALSAAVVPAVGCDTFAGGETADQAPGELPPEFAKLDQVWTLLEQEHIDAESLDPQAAADGAIRGMLDSVDAPHDSYLDSNQHFETMDEALGDLPPEFARLDQVWELLEQDHTDSGSLDPQAAADGAIRGMLDSIDDPHAAYLDTGQYSMMRTDIQGYFEGIGAEVGIRNGLITIIAPIPDTPADEAGVKAKDVILEIDGESTAGMELFEAINLIRGQQGTSVRLLVRRDRTGESEELVIVRGVIPLESVRLTMLVGRIGHLRITSFSGTSQKELRTALERFQRSQGLGLIVDVRNNPGGLVSSVVEVTSEFVDDGLVLYQLDGQGNRRDWNAESGGMALDVPMVVLLNNGSASASEVFAGAIMDHGRAPTIGVTTYGKGSVNNLWPLTDGSAVNFTVARWYTPSGKLIEGEGVTPDIIQEPSDDDSEDPQLDLAIAELTKLIENGQANAN